MLNIFVDRLQAVESLVLAMNCKFKQTSGAFVGAY